MQKLLEQQGTNLTTEIDLFAQPEWPDPLNTFPEKALFSFNPEDQADHHMITNIFLRKCG